MLPAVEGVAYPGVRWLRLPGRCSGAVGRRMNVRALALIAGVVVVMLASAAPALADRAMSTRFSMNDNGNITFAANTLMVCPAAASWVHGGSEHGADLERDQQRAEQQHLQHAVRQYGAGDGRRGGDVRLLLGDAVAAVDGDGAVCGPLLGCRHQRRGDDRRPGRAAGRAELSGSDVTDDLCQPCGAPGCRRSGYAQVTASQVDISSGTATRYTAFADVTS